MNKHIVTTLHPESDPVLEAAIAREAYQYALYAANERNISHKKSNNGVRSIDEAS